MASLNGHLGRAFGDDLRSIEATEIVCACWSASAGRISSAVQYCAYWTPAVAAATSARIVLRTRSTGREPAQSMARPAFAALAPSRHSTIM